jgi:DNA (cytosine-5)-methyltransferase 1
MPEIKLGSLFSGAGGFELCAVRAGITPVWASEIEPFPIAVTSKNFPDMRHLGDIRSINGAEIEPVDIITFGSPCQDMSIAGKRAGLAGEHSGLFLEAIRVIKEMRCSSGGNYPRFIVWENVPGSLSSSKGEDFRTVLQEIVKIKAGAISISRSPGKKWLSAGEILGDTFSVAWRILDAKYFGVPQRRCRIFLVADLAGQSAGEILFECQSVQRDTAPRGAAGETDPEQSQSCAGASFLQQNQNWEVRLTAEAPTLTTNGSASARNMPILLKIRSGREGGGKGVQTSNDISSTIQCSNDQVLFVSADNSEYSIRRLTPLECSRLQGFPDDWCVGIPHSDTAEYKLWGNSVAIPCAQFVIGRLARKIANPAEVFS